MVTSVKVSLKYERQKISVGTYIKCERFYIPNIHGWTIRAGFDARQQSCMQTDFPGKKQLEMESYAGSSTISGSFAPTLVLQPA